MQTAQTAEIAAKLNRSESQTRRILKRCLDAGLVERVGQRGGWRLTAAGLSLITPRHAPPSGE
jgi:predicted transcriptional regulator